MGIYVLGHSCPSVSYWADLNQMAAECVDVVHASLSHGTQRSLRKTKSNYREAAGRCAPDALSHPPEEGFHHLSISQVKNGGLLKAQYVLLCPSSCCTLLFLCNRCPLACISNSLLCWQAVLALISGCTLCLLMTRWMEIMYRPDVSRHPMRCILLLLWHRNT